MIMLIHIVMLYMLKVDVADWISSKHNMGMSLTRDTWKLLRQCAKVIYNHYSVALSKKNVFLN